MGYLNQKFSPNSVFWTDYPFKELGDESGKPAPHRPVTVSENGYDGYKYVEVILYTGERTQVKAGYLHDSHEALVDWMIESRKTQLQWERDRKKRWEELIITTRSLDKESISVPKSFRGRFKRMSNSIRDLIEDFRRYAPECELTLEGDVLEFFAGPVLGSEEGGPRILLSENVYASIPLKKDP